MEHGYSTRVARLFARVGDVMLREPGRSGTQTSSDGAARRPWSARQCVAFRWASLYILFYCLPFPAGALPGFDWAEDLWQEPWHSSIVPWVAAHVLHLEQPVALLNTGSGDTLYHWVQLFTYCALATTGAIVWSIVDRRRTDYARAFAWLYLYVRYDVAWEMLRYGIHKVFALQFATGPTLSRMLEPYGESSPFGLASTFMGSSTTYLMLAGAAETVGGALLIFPPLTTLGALIVVPIMVNVALMNFCYDIPVKIHSSHILLLTLFLLLPEARRLIRAIVLGSSVEGTRQQAFSHGGWMGRGRNVLKLAVVAGLVVPQVLMNRTTAAHLAERHPLFGIYEVAPGAMPNDVRTIIIDEVRVLAIRRASGPLQRFQIAGRSEPGSLTLVPYRRSGQKAKLQYRATEDGQLVLMGSIDDEAFDLRLQKMPTPSFPLQTRGFHWVNDYAFDR